MRVVKDDDVLYAEQMLRDGDEAQRIDGAPSCHDDGEHGRGRCHAIALAPLVVYHIRRGPRFLSTALSLTQQEPEQRFQEKRLSELRE
jgi:hypothetical protein